MTENPFPLPAGHYYGPTGWDLVAHDGLEVRDSGPLLEWQRLYAARWDRDMVPTGVFAGPTQRAALRIQREAGLPLTGNVDEPTWIAGLVGGTPPKTDDVTPDLSKQLEETRRAADRAKQQEANRTAHALKTEAAERERTTWKKRSSLEHQYAQAGCPPWWPNHDFGPGDGGMHVAKVCRILGMTAEKRFTEALEQRVRGLQSAGGLEASGVVDLPTAKLLDKV